MEIVERTTEGKKDIRQEVKNETEKSQEGVGKEKVDKKITISVDNSPEEVVQWDSEGKRLEFEHDAKRFLRLPSDVVRELSYENKRRYYVSKGMAEETIDLSSYDKRNIKPRPGFAMASDRLAVYNKKPGMEYCWKRPDELRQAHMDGYREVQDPDIKTFGGDVGSTHTVGMYGDTELVLMEIPKETRDRQRAALRQKDEIRRKGVESTAIADLQRSGGKPYVPSDDEE